MCNTLVIDSLEGCLAKYNEAQSTTKENGLLKGIYVVLTIKGNVVSIIKVIERNKKEEISEQPDLRFTKQLSLEKKVNYSL